MLNTHATLTVLIHNRRIVMNASQLRTRLCIWRQHCQQRPAHHGLDLTNVARFHFHLSAAQTFSLASATGGVAHHASNSHIDGKGLIGHANQIALLPILARLPEAVYMYICINSELVVYILSVQYIHILVHSKYIYTYIYMCICLYLCYTYSSNVLIYMDNNIARMYMHTCMCTQVYYMYICYLRICIFVFARIYIYGRGLTPPPSPWSW